VLVEPALDRDRVDANTHSKYRDYLLRDSHIVDPIQAHPVNRSAKVHYPQRCWSRWRMRRKRISRKSALTSRQLVILGTGSFISASDRFREIAISQVNNNGICNLSSMA
jgi:hypothetical protein